MRLRTISHLREDCWIIKHVPLNQVFKITLLETTWLPECPWGYSTESVRGSWTRFLFPFPFFLLYYTFPTATPPEQCFESLRFASQPQLPNKTYCPGSVDSHRCSTPWWTNQVMAAAIRVSPCLSFFPPLWGITRQREWEAIITSLMWAACASHLQKKKKKGTRTPDHRTHLRLYRAKSPLGCGRSLQDDARRHQTIWLLANTMTWWERTLGSRLYAAISQRCKGWMVKTCDHSLVHQEVPWVQSLHHLPGKEKERERDTERVRTRNRRRMIMEEKVGMCAC